MLDASALLALAARLGAPVVTIERVWSKLKLGIPVHLAR